MSAAPAPPPPPTSSSGTSAAAEAAAAEPAPPGRTQFWLRRLHSASGVLPLGGFLLEHLWTNASALWGQRRFDSAVARIEALPGLVAIEVLGIFLPLAFHAGYGLWLTRRSRANVGTYPYTRNWGYLLQRISGLVLLAFLLFHLWEFRIQKWLFGMDSRSFYPVLAAGLSSTRWGIPWRAVFYLAGLLAACTHFGNGLFGFACTWGLAGSRRAQKRFFAACCALGAGTFLLGTLTVVHFATGPFWPHDPAPRLGDSGARCTELPQGPPRSL